MRDFDRVREPRPKQVAFVVEEDLRLVDETTKRRAVNDAIAIALEVVPGRRPGFGVATTACLICEARPAAVLRFWLVYSRCASRTRATSESGAFLRPARPGDSMTTNLVSPATAFLS